jgi:hypothetical protein
VILVLKIITSLIFSYYIIYSCKLTIYSKNNKKKYLLSKKKDSFYDPHGYSKLESYVNHVLCIWVLMLLASCIGLLSIWTLSYPYSLMIVVTGFIYILMSISYFDFLCEEIGNGI